MQVTERGAVDTLIAVLKQREFRVIGPTIRDGAIVYDELTSTADLPVGWTDTQEGGTYRLTRRNDTALFGYAVGPHSWKQFLHPPTVRLWQARRDGRGFQVIAEREEPPRFAFIGVRSCELHAIAVQDKVFLEGTHVDPVYKARRDNVFIVAVNCGQAGGTCFCVSMHTGPKATLGFDLALTEVLAGERHYFVVESGTARGAEILQEIPHREASTVTRALQQVKRGDVVGVQGPFGSSWPLQEAEGNDVVLVAGGLGLAPLRPAFMDGFSCSTVRERPRTCFKLVSSNSGGAVSISMSSHQRACGGILPGPHEARTAAPCRAAQMGARSRSGNRPLGGGLSVS